MGALRRAGDAGAYAPTPSQAAWARAAGLRRDRRAAQAERLPTSTGALWRAATLPRIVLWGQTGLKALATGVAETAHGLVTVTAGAGSDPPAWRRHARE